ncbi:hypothetical protein B0I27_104299 [Arcticibacter pallidicorallinus]|uniref:Carboxypeptidase family protein n=1 Tax=Arcticibacter pallidicorallinus TaxID=1259464 RepID=A0A2T0U5U9_9SPHI|nr:hypothetical protein [Arcticibacter pallidicorallinus]PRY53289.1 hypothetical protein B0I27_104299 [Arcticibacter pallidicorallinus]
MKKLSQLTWIYISIGGFVLFAVFFFFTIKTGRRIELDISVYFFLIIIIGLIASGFLAGAMKSVSRYENSGSNGKLYLAGPVVIFCIVMYFGYQYRPLEKKGPLSLAVRLTGSQSSYKIPENASVNVVIDLFQQTKILNSEGIAFFTGISDQYKGRKIDLFLNVSGYHPENAQIYKLSDSSDHTNLIIQLQRDVEITTLQGRLYSSHDKTGIPDAVVRFVGTSYIANTDSLGNFSAKLPVKPGSEIRIIAFKGNKEVYNSLRTVYQDDFLTLTQVE